MAAANLNTIRATIESRLATELASNPAIPVVFNNISYAPTPNSSWVQCLLSFGATEYISHGGYRPGLWDDIDERYVSIDDLSNWDTATDSLQEESYGYNRFNGIVVINVFSRPGEGTMLNYSTSERVRNLYNRRIVSGIFFDAPIGPEVIKPASPDAFFQTQVRVTFEYIEEL